MNISESLPFAPRSFFRVKGNVSASKAKLKNVLDILHSLLHQKRLVLQLLNIQIRLAAAKPWKNVYFQWIKIWRQEEIYSLAFFSGVHICGGRPRRVGEKFKFSDTATYHKFHGDGHSQPRQLHRHENDETQPFRMECDFEKEILFCITTLSLDSFFAFSCMRIRLLLSSPSEINDIISSKMTNCWKWKSREFFRK